MPRRSEVEGVACHFTVPERVASKAGSARRRGLGHFARLSPDRPDPLQGQAGAGRRHVSAAALVVLQEDADRRGCDAKRNVLVYMVYFRQVDRGSPKNSTSSVPIMPWGAADATVQKCGEFIQ